MRREDPRMLSSDSVTLALNSLNSLNCLTVTAPLSLGRPQLSVKVKMMKYIKLA